MHCLFSVVMHLFNLLPDDKSVRKKSAQSFTGNCMHMNQCRLCLLCIKTDQHLPAIRLRIWLRNQGSTPKGTSLNKIGSCCDFLSVLDNNEIEGKRRFQEHHIPLYLTLYIKYNFLYWVIDAVDRDHQLNTIKGNQYELS